MSDVRLIEPFDVEDNPPVRIVNLSVIVIFSF